MSEALKICCKNQLDLKFNKLCFVLVLLQNQEGSLVLVNQVRHVSSRHVKDTKKSFGNFKKSALSRKRMSYYLFHQ